MLYTKTTSLTKLKIQIFWNKDILYDSIWMNKFLNQCTWQGKKEKIEKYFTNCLFLLRKVTLVPKIYFFEIMMMLKPVIILRWIRLGRKWHSIARPISEELQYRCTFLMLSSVFKVNEGARKLQGTPDVKLFNEMMNILHSKTSKLLNYKKDTYSIAVYNRSLFRFKW